MEFCALLQELEAWRGSYLSPVSQAMYLNDQTAARSALAAAALALEESALGSAEREALRLNWLYHRAQCDYVFAGSEEERRAAFEAGLEELSAPAISALARAEQASMLLFLRVSMMRRGLRPFLLEEFEELFGRVPAELRHDYFWHVVSSWAFASRNLDYLAEAFAAISLQPPGEDAEAFWQRMNLMYQLLKGEASELDVEQYISRLRLHSMAQEFEKHIWPRIVEAGLGSARLEQAYRDRFAEMDSAGRQVPRPTPGTRSLLSRHLRPVG